MSNLESSDVDCSRNYLREAGEELADILRSEEFVGELLQRPGQRHYRLSELRSVLEAAGHRTTTRTLLNDIKAGRLRAFRRVEGGAWYVDQAEYKRVMYVRGTRPARALPDKPRKQAWTKYNYVAGLKKRYGLTPERYATMLEEQDGCCAICGCDPAVKYAHQALKVRRLHVDHWHDDTTAVRGLLCHNCNFGIGRWLDNPQLLKAAIRYLDTHLPLRLTS